jgi:hypothetical protein
MLDRFEHLKKLFSFSWAQALSDSTGKSSITAVIGLIVTFTGCTGFLYATFTKDPVALPQSTIVITLGTSIILGRKVVNGKPGELPDVPNQTS